MALELRLGGSAILVSGSYISCRKYGVEQYRDNYIDITIYRGTVTDCSIRVSRSFAIILDLQVPGYCFQ